MPLEQDKIRKNGDPDAVSPSATPALYLGADRGRIGNAEGLPEGKVITYTLPDRQEDDIFYAEGSWKIFADRLTFNGPRGGAIYLNYSAKEVHLQMGSEEEAIVWINQDRRTMRRDEIGEDVTIDEKGRALVRVKALRVYRLVRNPGFEKHELRLFTQARGLSLYAFTFVSCTVSPQ